MTLIGLNLSDNPQYIIIHI